MINISCINNLILYEINLSRPSLSWNDVDYSVVEAVLPSLWQTNSRCPQSLSTLGTTWSVWRPSPLWGLLVHWPRYWAPQDWLNSWQLVVQKYQRQSFWCSGVSIPPEPALPSPEYFLLDGTEDKNICLPNVSNNTDLPPLIFHSNWDTSERRMFWNERSQQKPCLACKRWRIPPLTMTGGWGRDSQVCTGQLFGDDWSNWRKW